MIDDPRRLFASFTLASAVRIVCTPISKASFIVCVSMINAFNKLWKVFKYKQMKKWIRRDISVLSYYQESLLNLQQKVIATMTYSLFSTCALSSAEASIKFDFASTT